MRRWVVLVRAFVAVGILAAVAGIGMSAASADGPIVTGGGSSFVGLEVSQWKADVAKPPYNLKINYTSAGSGFGRDKFATGVLDFGQSDIAYRPDEPSFAQARSRNYVYVPTSAGALAFLFNVIGSNGSRISNLKLTANAACRLFTVPGIKWNDPVIAATNPGVPLPDRTVRPVIRSDSSGTSYVLSEFCIARAPDAWNAFKSYIATSNQVAEHYLSEGEPVSTWPAFPGTAAAFASDGVGRTLTSNPDSVTYVETGYTKVTGMPAAYVQNPAGVFTPPNPANSTVALGYATADPSAPGTFKLSYTGGDPRAYFPSTYSYAIAQTTGFPVDKGAVLAAYLNYAVCKGQDRAEPLLYSRLSLPLVNIALDNIAKIPGAPPRPATASCNAPPPPTLKNAPAAAGGGKTSGSGGGGPGAGTGTGPSANAGAGDVTASTVADGAQNAAEQAAAADDAAAAAGGGDGGTNTKNTSSSGTGPENSDVLFTFLLGAGLVAVGTFVSRGTRSSWHR